MSRRLPPRSRMAAPAALLVALALAGCSGGNYEPTQLPTTEPVATSSTKPPAPVACDNPTQSYEPLPSIPPRSALDDPGMARITADGKLTVGVSADTYLLAARNPISGDIEGFDIDIARAIAERLFGDPDAVELRVISAADRLPVLQDREVELVARNMTMNCARWKDIAFSAEYYHSGQKVLVNRDSTAVTLDDLDGQRVCAPAQTTSLTKLQTFPGVEVVTSDSHTGCLVLFQQGQADAITGDDTVLAGLAAQDPYAKVTTGEAITDEPYGLGVNRGDVYFVRYLNAVLDQMKADGTWTEIYNRWLRTSLGKAPKPPVSEYGRGS